MPSVKRCVGVMLLTFSGCTVGPDYKPPQVNVNGGYGELGGAATQPSTAVAQPIALAEWWTTFRDPELDSLEQRATKANLNLVQAQSRVRQARAQLGVVGADVYPQVNVDSGYFHGRGSKNVVIPPGAFGGSSSSSGSSSGGSGSSGAATAGRVKRADQSSSGGGGSGGGPPQELQSPLGAGGLPGVDSDLYQIGFDATWELDIFGGTRRAVEAAEADLAANSEDRRDVLISVLAEVARDYIQLRGIQREIQISEDNLHSQQDTLNLTRDRFTHGLSTQLDVSRAAAQVATTAATLPSLHAAGRQYIHGLGLLLAEQPTDLEAELDKPGPIPPVPPTVPVGLPAELLRRRPDVRRAERQLAASTARIGEATADLYPRFTLNGTLGLDATQPRHLFDFNSRYYSIIPGVTWPLFDAGRIRANIQVQNEARQQLVANYQQTVLAAVKDVEDALVAYSDEQLRRTALQQAVDADKQAVELATQQYTQGVTDFLTVLEAQRELFAAEDALVQSDRTISSNLVSLYKALGGGWEIEKGGDAG